MKHESAAGGVVFCLLEKELSVLLIKDLSGAWTFPKGLVKKGEDERVAAQREIFEETGITDLVEIADIGSISYGFVRVNEDVSKNVHYFAYLAAGMTEPQPQTEEHISHAAWIPIKKAYELIGYRETNIPVLDLAVTAVTKNN